MSDMKNMNRLLDIMAALRTPDTGCPWDIKQTFKTIVPYTLEEAYEVADSIERGQMDELKDELGDLLFQVVFYAQMAREQDLFEFGDIVAAINDKLVRRHPHVFAGAEYKDEAALNDDWERAKSSERDQRAEADQASTLAGVARSLPALKRAQKLQKRAARVGFDWPDVAPVWNKLNEEVAELQEAVEEGDKDKIFDEMGDLLFSCVNLARHLGVDAEEALRQGNQKFTNRFNCLESELSHQNRAIEECDIIELEQLWQASKKSF
ncbi:MAG: nucleoside triphosphate pyrophosphohydrolase [Gammaproteobacteria bacterium]|nr:nucleoside triphosphate pyrophosphohydrolase [Gammaproteobacteria bacterium]MCW8910903.1 nucleoside triphosphate pyrophosphohydrolase [Gammaproteobacteria bacterium]MCW9004593.1 nucleoside triphosphate pyrophosphohydrolase [Gammaproteobacteria bacterium]MCW9056717.1 nucleoside triphosphate pyrophosphohydrolase [Gammaproteobacteria bacterium]